MAKFMYMHGRKEAIRNKDVAADGCSGLECKVRKNNACMYDVKDGRV